MNIEFMIFGVLFSALQTIQVLLFIFLLVLLAIQLYKLLKLGDVAADELFQKVKYRLLSVSILSLLVILVFMSMVNGSTAPKLSIDTPSNSALESYQQNDADIEIITPAPRTETLDGFTPLKQNNNLIRN
jgi:hypothetical protein